jgi:hypothetical protein
MICWAVSNLFWDSFLIIIKCIYDIIKRKNKIQIKKLKAIIINLGKVKK